MTDEQKTKKTNPKPFAVLCHEMDVQTNDTTSAIHKLPQVKTTAQALAAIAADDEKFPSGCTYTVVQICSDPKSKRQVTATVLE